MQTDNEIGSPADTLRTASKEMDVWQAAPDLLPATPFGKESTHDSEQSICEVHKDLHRRITDKRKNCSYQLKNWGFTLWRYCDDHEGEELKRGLLVMFNRYSGLRTEKKKDKKTTMQSTKTQFDHLVRPYRTLLCLLVVNSARWKCLRTDSPLLKLKNLTKSTYHLKIILYLTR